MICWEVQTPSGSLEVEGENWLVAAGKAISQLGLDSLDLPCLMCEAHPEGLLRISDQGGVTLLHLRKVPVGDPAAVATVEAPEAGPAPVDLGERLFIRSTEISDADSLQEAAEAALAVIEDFVPSEASSVLYASINDTALIFLATREPGESQLTGMKVPFDESLAGYCFNSGAELIVKGADQHPRHDSEIDELKGHRTRDLLSVPLKDNAGRIHGCVQLLNPPTEFEPWQVEVVRTFATSLAEFIGARSE